MHFWKKPASPSEWLASIYKKKRVTADSLTPSGLSLESRTEIERFAEVAASEVESTVDIDRLLRATFIPDREAEILAPDKINLTVAVARDEAFNFIYPANLAGFQADVVFFSLLRDRVASQS